MKEVFTNIYTTNLWGSTETVSGTGSELANMVNIIEELPLLCAAYKINKVVDIGCGDFNWMQKVVSNFEYYLGIDVVTDIIKQNKVFASNRIKFRCGDFEKMRLQAYEFDAVILNDVLVHFSFIDIKRTLAALRKLNIKYILMTHFTELEENRNIETGDWRPLSMCKHPFKLPKPLEVILNKSNEHNADGKSLSLWEF